MKSVCIVAIFASVATPDFALRMKANAAPNTFNVVAIGDSSSGSKIESRLRRRGDLISHIRLFRDAYSFDGLERVTQTLTTFPATSLCVGTEATVSSTRNRDFRTENICTTVMIHSITAKGEF
jgi:hypothetical protein